MICWSACEALMNEKAEPVEGAFESTLEAPEINEKALEVLGPPVLVVSGVMAALFWDTGCGEKNWSSKRLQLAAGAVTAF